MTPKRKKALQWLHDAGEATPQELLTAIGRRMFTLMSDDRQSIAIRSNRGLSYTWSLTDRGRRDLNGDTTPTHNQETTT